MNIQKSLQDAWELLLLKEARLNSIAKDKNALQPALIIFVVASLLAAFGSMFFPYSVDMVHYKSGFFDVLLQGSFSALLGIGMLYLSGYLAEKLFHSKLDAQGYVNIMGHVGLVNVLGVIPAFSFVSGIWTLVVMCFALNKVGKLQAGSIVLLILLQVFLMVFLLGGIVLARVGSEMGKMMF